MTVPRVPGASEFGGVRGPIAPQPHDPKTSVHEQIRHVYATESTDPESSPEQAYADELKQVRE